MALLPSGDFLVAEKGVGQGTAGVAQVRLVRKGIPVIETVMSLSVTVIGDSGIYSILLDPGFAVNHYFYLWYSAGEDALQWPGYSVDRLSRFTYDPHTRKAELSSETIILDGIRWSQLHNGGAITIDKDGNLFIATGDATSYAFSQDMSMLNGKLLRIRPLGNGGYSVPTANSGVAQSEVRPEIYASGLRNPFRMAWRPEEQVYYLIDVGAGAWEEVNRVEAGANYGWAVREGPCPFTEPGPDCEPAEPIFTDPVVTYPHPKEGGAGITALAFYAGTSWPAPYQGNLFFADFNSRYLSMVDLDDPKVITRFASEVGNLVDIEATADGLYLLSIYDGAIRFVHYSDDGNQWPTASVSAVPSQGSAPLTVHFSGNGSIDPENDALTYLWDFGDGSPPITSTESLVMHEYQSDGNFQSSLQVVDGMGGKSEPQRATIQVYSGAMPLILSEIEGDSGRQQYRGGDRVRFTVTRAGGTAGLDATTPYIWSIKQHHNEHVHFITTSYAAGEVALEIPNESHAIEPSIWYEAELTMVTDQGQEVSVTHGVYPDLVVLDVSSSPAGASVEWNGVQQPSDQPISAIVGQHFTIKAPEIHYNGHTKNRFTHWEIITEGDEGESEIITERSFSLLVSAEKKRYIAHYEFVAAAQERFLPSLRNNFTGAAE
jgi:glucose/arabinose dehydrogenase